MSQATNGLAIPNEPGATFRSDVNAALQQLATQASGATAPSTTYPYQTWYDTANNVLKVRNAANNAWVTTCTWGDSTQHVLYTNNAAKTYTDSNGQTGFGVSTPAYKVDVSGDANVTGVYRIGGVKQLFLGNDTVASASTTDLSSVDKSCVTISGTTTITSFGSTAAAGTLKFCTLSGSLMLTHNATSLICPTGADIYGVAGDTFTALSLGSGNWRVLNYTPGGTTSYQNVLGADVSLNNTSNYFDGPSVAQGTAGKWEAEAELNITDTAGAAAYIIKLWDGTTVVKSMTISGTVANELLVVKISGIFTSPAGNIRASVRDTSSTSGKILFNQSGFSKDSDIRVKRVI